MLQIRYLQSHHAARTSTSRRFFTGTNTTHRNSHKRWNDGSLGDDGVVGVLEISIGGNIGLGLVDELGPVVRVNLLGIEQRTARLTLDMCIDRHEPGAEVDVIHLPGHLARQRGTCFEGEGCTDDAGPGCAGSNGIDLRDELFNLVRSFHAEGVFEEVCLLCSGVEGGG